MKTHNGTERIAKMYGSQHSTRKIYHRAQRRAAAREIREQLKELLSGFTFILSAAHQQQKGQAQP